MSSSLWKPTVCNTTIYSLQPIQRREELIQSRKVKVKATAGEAWQREKHAWLLQDFMKKSKQNLSLEAYDLQHNFTLQQKYVESTRDEEEQINSREVKVRLEVEGHLASRVSKNREKTKISRKLKRERLPFLSSNSFSLLRNMLLLSSFTTRFLISIIKGRKK